jgi:hypothetical protein
VQEIKTFNLWVLISWGLGWAVSKVFNKLWKLNLKFQLLAFYSKNNTVPKHCLTQISTNKKRGFKLI